MRCRKPSRRMLASGACAAILLPLALFSPKAQEAAAPADKKQALEALEGEIEAARKAKQAAETGAEAAARDAESLRKNLIDMTARIQSQETDVSELESKIKSLRAEETVKAGALVHRREQLATLLAGLERFSQQPAVTLIARPARVVDSARSAMLLGKVIPSLAEEARAIGAEIADLNALRTSIEDERVALAAETRILASRRGDIDTLIAVRTAEQEKLTAESRASEERMARLAAEAKDLASLIKKLEEQEARETVFASAARDAAARLSGKPTPPAARDSAALAARPFSSARGALPLPVAGKIVRLFGQADETGLPQKGVVVEARETAQVSAPHDGKVAFAGPFRHYGQLLIIAHGEGYHTLLAGMARIDVVVGQWVLAGEPIGRMGAEDATGELGVSGRRLYVELRRNGEPINPLPWLAARDRKVSG